jgi:cyanate permease
MEKLCGVCFSVDLCYQYWDIFIKFSFEKKKIMNKRTLLVLGQLSLSLGLAGFCLNQFYLENNVYLAFIVGIFIGLSLVMNLTF